MIDIDKLESECQCVGWDKYITAEISKGCVIELIAMIRQSEKDAARYRWLRDCTTSESRRLVVGDSGGWIVGLSVLDGMIDEAMQCIGDNK